MNDTRSVLERALEAGKVAVFGASPAPNKWGNVLVRRLLEQGYRGELALVNPRGGIAFGRPLGGPEIAAAADLAVAVTPATATLEVVDACGGLGIPLLVIESAGFAEVGEVQLERELRRRAAAAGVRLIGPNCLGIFAAAAGLNVTTLPPLPTGRVSFVSQSGGLALQVARRLAELGGGFDVLLSLGNKVDIGFADAIELLSARPQTEAVLLYLERVDEGERLLAELESACRSKAVIAVVGGRTETGRAAAVSHTGSMLGHYERAVGVLADAGVLVLNSLSLAAAAATGAIGGRGNECRRPFAVVDGGGHSVLLADALASAGVEMVAPTTELAARLREHGWRASNPLDLAGAADADPRIYADVLAAVLESGIYDCVVLGGLFGGYAEVFGDHLADAESEAAVRIGTLAALHGADVMLQSTYATSGAPALELARKAGVACVEWPEEAVAVLAARARGREQAAPAPDPVAPRMRSLVDRQMPSRTAAVLDVFEEQGLCHGLGGLVTREGLPREGGPWVLRLDGFIHKARVGAIRLGLVPADLTAAYDELCRLARRHGLEPLVRVAPMLQVQDELAVTFWSDRAIGHGYIVGAGGGAIEELRDVAVGRPPRVERDVLSVLSRTRIGRGLAERGALDERGGLDEVAGFILRLAFTFQSHLSWVRELECNPLALTPAGPVILDVVVSA